jgi:predicted AAA+ superfamily ATPase
MVKHAQLPRKLKAPDRSFFLFGARGSGKSTWLNLHFSGATTIDLLDEALFQRYLVDAGLLGRKLAAVPEDSWVVIDEIQRLPNLLNEVHRFIEARGLKFALSGSSARKLRRSGTNLLGGRALRREMFPLLPEELSELFNLKRMLTQGSLPLIWTAGGTKDVLASYVQTYLREEVQAEALVRNLPGFARFLPVAALFHGQVLNATSLARDAGVARSTVLSYLDILEDTLLAFRLPAYEGKLRVKEKTHPKLYWVDSGIARAARRRFGTLHEDERGPLFEGFIAGVLRAYHSYDDAFDDWHYWAPTATAALEVDFLLWREDICVAVEVKASSRYRGEYTKGLRALKSGMGTSLVRQIVVYLGADVMRTAEGIEVLPLQHFLDELQQGKLFP